MGRSPCCSKEKEELNRGAWSALEDQILTDYIKLHGEGKWRSLANRAGLKRCGKSCRLRWVNYLRPNIKRGDISQDEEDLIIRLHKLLGNKWSLIAGRLPGRTDNEIKNYWNTTLGKKIKGTFSLELHGNLQKHITQQSAQVVRPKASRCTKVLAPPLEVENSTKNGAGGPIAGEVSATTKVKSLIQNAADEPPIAGGCVIQNSKQLETIELSTLTTEDDDLLNSLMDFDVDELCLSSILDSEYLHNGNDGTQYDGNPTLDSSNEMPKYLTKSDCKKNNLCMDVQSSVSFFYSEEECVGDYLQLGCQ